MSDHPRNLDDEQLQWVKKNGGVVQAVALGLFVNKEKQENYESAVKKLNDNTNNYDLEKIKKEFPPVSYQIL